MCPDRLTENFLLLAAQLIWLERRRDEARALVAPGHRSSYFVAEGRLMSCGIEVWSGQLGHGEFDADHRVVAMPMLLPSMAEVRICGVAAGMSFGAAFSAEGKVYTWGWGANGRLGHGDADGCLIPKQVQAIAEVRMRAVAAGNSHRLSVTESGEVFSWGRGHEGQCGHWGNPEETSLFLPRSVKTLAGVRVRSATGWL